MKTKSFVNSQGASAREKHRFDLSSKTPPGGNSFGQWFINAAVLVHAIKPVLMIVAMIVFAGLSAVSPTFAQTSGATLGGNSSNPINAFKTALDIGVWVLLGLGIGGIGWGIYNVMFGNGFSRQFIGGGCALGFAGIVALINDVANDTAPPVPTY